MGVKLLQWTIAEKISVNNEQVSNFRNRVTLANPYLLGIKYFNYFI